MTAAKSTATASQPATVPDSAEPAAIIKVTATAAAILSAPAGSAAAREGLTFPPFSAMIFFLSSAELHKAAFPDGADAPRKGEDINYTMQIDFLTAAQGAEKTVSLNGKSINVKIPAGTQNGQTLRLKGLGQPSLSGGEAGDVLITMNVGGHPYFSADGLNILLELPITMKEAVLGAKVTIPTISGKVAG